MIGFFIKKSFFDGWDNLITLLVLNLGFVAFLGIAYAAVLSFGVSLLLGVFLAVVTFGVGNIFIGSVSLFVRHFSWYRRAGFQEFRECVREALRPSLLNALLMFFLLMLVFIVMPFYAGMQSLLGAGLTALLFWAAVFITMALFYYFPVVAQLHETPRRALKKSFLLVFDNIGFSIFLLFYTFVNLLLSFATAFLIPGFSSILMTHQNAVKLLMYKYDYLEEHPDVSRRSIPWGALLMEEKEQVGHRTLRGMIFPWKE